MLKGIEKDNLFHAYICEGGTEVLDEINNFIEIELGMSRNGNPDVFIKHYEAFGVGDSREVTRLAQLKPIGERKILCLSAPSMTIEAQDALLKLFEEPPAHTHFFVVLPSVNNLRPTLLSRVQILSARMFQGSLETFAGAAEFLQMSYAKRLDIVGKIAKDKNRGEALKLINALEANLYKCNELNHLQKTEGLEALAQTRKYLGDKGSMLKQLLESVAIQLPIQKN